MRRTRILLLLLLASFLLAGILEPFLALPGSTHSGGAALHAIVIAVLCYAWCKADAKERGTPGIGGAALAGLLPPIGLPIYFFRSRTARNALVSLAISLLLLVASILLFGAGLYIGKVLQNGT
jgi:hypothetical protein